MNVIMLAGGAVLIPVVLILIFIGFLTGMVWPPSFLVAGLFFYLCFRWLRTTFRIAGQESDGPPMRYPATTAPIPPVTMPKYPAASALDDPHWVDSYDL